MNNSISIAVTGFPNVGKSTIFNLLTGLKQHTGNWGGVTVELSKGNYKYNEINHIVTDLPGTYSLLSESEDEQVAAMYICNENPDVTVIVCDGLCLERNFNLVLQILDITPKAVVCINFSDQMEKSKISVNIDYLSKTLKVPVVLTTGKTGNGIEELKESIIKVGKNFDFSKDDNKVVDYGAVIEGCLNKIQTATAESFPKLSHTQIRWASIRLLCGDFTNYDIITGSNTLPQNVEEALSYANSVISVSYPKSKEIDDIISTKILSIAKDVSDKTISTEEKKKASISHKVDRVVTSKLYGIPLMFALLCLVFYITITFANYPSQFLADHLFAFEDTLLSWSNSIGTPEWVNGILILGVYKTVAWVVSVMLPPMAIFFPLFTFLEDLGYLPRVAFNLDGIFSRAGCCGKQSLTACMGFGCNAAAIIGCRIISSPKEKLIAILTNVFTPCNGRFPTIIAILVMFFAVGTLPFASSVVSTILLGLVIFISVLLTLAVSKILSTTLLKGTPSTFVLEMPPYRMPKLKDVLVRSVLDRTLKLLLRAVIISAPAGLIIWFMANTHVNDMTLLAHCTTFLEPLGQFMGLDGVILMAFILGFPANEIVVPIIIMTYTANGFMLDYEGLDSLKVLLVDNGWTIKTAICTILFCLAHFPCGTTCLTIKKETSSVKWTLASIVIPTVCGIILCSFVNMIFNFFII